MRRVDRFWVIGYREWSILAFGAVFPAIGVLMLSESSNATSTAIGVLVIVGGVFIVWLGIRRSVAIADSSGVRLVCRISRNRRISREELHSVRLLPGGESLFSACSVTLVTWPQHGGTVLLSEAMTWKGGVRRGTRLAETLHVSLEIERADL